MAVINIKPTTPGQRGKAVVRVDYLHKGEPLKSLVESKSKVTGRSSAGRITVRHKGGGQKRAYRLIDFKRKKDDIEAIVERIEYDPNRSAFIALILYADGARSYILASKNMRANDVVTAGPNAPLKEGNVLPLGSIPIGTTISHIEISPGKGAQIARSAGSYAQITAREEKYAFIRLRSGEVRRVLLTCRAMLGEISNNEHNLEKLGKAGASRWRGIRPTVRGVAMNPVDHPHGGGEGKTSGGRHPVTPWGQKTKGRRTRHNPLTDYVIVTSRHKRKKH